jgi:hypothetical protein
MDPGNQPGDDDRVHPRRDGLNRLRSPSLTKISTASNQSLKYLHSAAHPDQLRLETEFVEKAFLIRNSD